MSRYKFIVDGNYVNFNDGINTVIRLHNSSRCITWIFDDTTGIKFTIDDSEYQTDTMSDIEIDGNILSAQADFETNIKLIFPGYDSGSPSLAGLLNDRGEFAAVTDDYPTTGGSGPVGAIRKGDTWNISTAGFVSGSQPINAGYSIRALADDAGFDPSQWAIMSNQIPLKLTTSERDIGVPVEGVTIYNTTLHKLQVYDGSTWQSSPSLGYKSYIATLTQSGTNAPVANELENSAAFGDWEYSGAGNYFLPWSIDTTKLHISGVANDFTSEGVNTVITTGGGKIFLATRPEGFRLTTEGSVELGVFLIGQSFCLPVIRVYD